MFFALVFVFSQLLPAASLAAGQSAPRVNQNNSYQPPVQGPTGAETNGATLDQVQAQQVENNVGPAGTEASRQQQQEMANGQQQQANQAQQQANRQQEPTTVDDCKDARDTAIEACETQSTTAGMTAAQAMQAQQYQQQASQANANVQQFATAQAQQCENQAMLNGALSGLSALKGSACVASAGTCKKKCEAAYQYHRQKNQANDARQADRLGEKCRSLTGNSAQAYAQAAAMLANMFSNMQCAKMYQAIAAQAAASPSPTPSGDRCDWDQAYARVTPVCICKYDPKNPVCANPNTSAGGVAASASGPLGSTSPFTQSSTGDDDEAGNGSLIDGMEGKADTAKGSNSTPGGQGGGPQASQGGGGKGGDFGGEGGYPASNVDKSVITGSGGGGGGNGAGGGGGGAPMGQLAGRESDGDRDPAGKFDLSKYLPKQGKVGGLSGHGADGVTGAMGPSIWEKVSNQYNLQKPNLIMDK